MSAFIFLNKPCGCCSCLSSGPDPRMCECEPSASGRCPHHTLSGGFAAKAPPALVPMQCQPVEELRPTAEPVNTYDLPAEAYELNLEMHGAFWPYEQGGEGG